MQSKKYLQLLIAWVACYLVIGIPYWRLAYSQVSLPDSLFGYGLLLTFLSALALCFHRGAFLWTAAAFGLCTPAVVTTRIILDTAKDATTHSLFPFELAIAVVVGFGISAFGAALGMLIGKLTGGKTNV